MPTLTVDQLRPFSEAIFVAAGASPTNAARVTEAMLKANLAGHDSHGVQHIPGYVRSLENGSIKGQTTPRILQETATTALVSGGWTFGHVGAGFATQLAIKKAQQQRLAAVSLVESTHIGRLGEYGEMGVESGTIIIILEGFGHKAATQAPFGGRQPLLGTNPISIGIPAGQQPGMVLDFATTVVAAGKLAVARAKGQPAPAGALIDRDGRPTTNPDALGEGGALLPFGGHKGFALALAIEFLGRVLAGGETYATSHQTPFNEAGTLILALDPATFRPLADYAAAADDLVQRVHAIPPAEGFSEVMLPGEPELRSRAARGQSGIPLPDSTWQSLLDTAQRYHVSPPNV